VGIDVRSIDPDLTDALRWHLEPFWVADRERGSIPVTINPSPDERATYRYNGAQTADLSTPVGTLRYAVRDLNGMAPKRSRDFLSIHSGAASMDGSAVLLPAGMEAGKSTTTAALLQEGFHYLSDEAAAIDPVTARVFPFPKRIWLHEDAFRFFPGLLERLGDAEGLNAELIERYPERHIKPEDLGSEVGSAATVRWIVFPEPERDGPPRLEPFPKAEAIERMAHNSFNLFRYGDRGVILLSRVVDGAEIYRLTGGTPKERAEAIRERVES
jgi:hypothetical protein